MLHVAEAADEVTYPFVTLCGRIIKRKRLFNIFACKKCLLENLKEQ